MTLFKIIEQAHKIINTPSRFRDEILLKSQQQFQDTMKKMLPDTTEKLLAITSEYETHILKSKIIPYLSTPVQANHWQRPRFDNKPIARWILQRVFELGWKKKWHGEID